MHNLRQIILQHIQHSLTHNEFTYVISSLVVGVKTDTPQAHIDILQNTGTIHLLAISGLHIGLLATMCFFTIRVLWRFVPAGWLWLPAPWLAASGAFAISLIYALLAGFGIATQRTLVMVAMALAGIIFKRKISAVNAFCVAVLLVLLWDPFAHFGVGVLVFFCSGSVFNVRCTCAQ